MKFKGFVLNYLSVILTIFFRILCILIINLNPHTHNFCKIEIFEKSKTTFLTKFKPPLNLE